MDRCVICGTGPFTLANDLTPFNSNIIDGTCEDCRNYLISKEMFVFNNTPTASDLSEVAKEDKVLVSRFTTVEEKDKCYNEVASVFEDDMKDTTLTYWSMWVLDMPQLQFEQQFLDEFHKRTKN